MEPSKSPLVRSSSRKKRSTTNLADLRLAPLSSKYTENPRDRAPAPKSPYDESQSSETYFARQHSSYLQGKSAPTTPGILSRSSSRTRLGGGLSRRGSLHDDEQEDEASYAYGTVPEAFGGGRSGLAGDSIPKAKSDAHLLGKHGKSRSITSVSSQRKHHSRRPTGEKRAEAREDDWLTRTGAATNAMLQESKGQSWLASRETSAAIVVDTDDDEGYEEAAALSAWSSSASKLRSADPNFSPTASRSASRWGSRYGSRPASRKTSRRGSLSGKTPTANPNNGPDYFGLTPAAPEDEIRSPLREAQPDEDEIARLTSNQSFGLGGIVDRFMGFNLFQSEERESATEDEVEPRENETEAQAKARMMAEAKRRREEKEKLVALRSAKQDEPVQAEGGWSDAAWLLSVASKAMF